MDNKIFSQIKRGLKVCTDYILAFILFVLFSMPVITGAKENAQNAITYLSVGIFIMLFFNVYVDMRNLAFNEKRPQYNINPPSYKGFLYGLIGIVPLVGVQIVLIMIKLPEEYTTLHRRIYQGFGGPLYWITRILGDGSVHYLISFVVLIIIAGLGYLAGFNSFYLLNYISQKLGIKKKVKNVRTKN
ncbi:MAG: hypothetical protein GX796_02275 [Clostridiaceae bacterium]|nr:hypothetical protein [Clostridiaceae bacterium]